MPSQGEDGEKKKRESTQCRADRIQHWKSSKMIASTHIATLLPCIPRSGASCVIININLSCRWYLGRRELPDREVVETGPNPLQPQSCTWVNQTGQDPTSVTRAWSNSAARCRFSSSLSALFRRLLSLFFFLFPSPPLCFTIALIAFLVCRLYDSVAFHLFSQSVSQSCLEKARPGTVDPAQSMFPFPFCKDLIQ